MHFVMSPSGIPENCIVLVARGGEDGSDIETRQPLRLSGRKKPLRSCCLKGEGATVVCLSPILHCSRLKGGLKLSLSS